MELFDLYTGDRVKTGKTMVRGEAVPEGYYRLVIHVCVFDEAGRMLIQQRQPFKKGWSNLWDITVGGSAVAGDSSRPPNGKPWRNWGSPSTWRACVRP